MLQTQQPPVARTLWTSLLLDEMTEYDRETLERISNYVGNSVLVDKGPRRLGYCEVSGIEGNVAEYHLLREPLENDMLTFRPLHSPPDHCTAYVLLLGGSPIGQVAKTEDGWAAYCAGKYIGTYKRIGQAAMEITLDPSV